MPCGHAQLRIWTGICRRIILDATLVFRYVAGVLWLRRIPAPGGIAYVPAPTMAPPDPHLPLRRCRPGQAAGHGGQAEAVRVGQDGDTDAQGDPLPEGALARLGTIRFRHSGEVTALAFSPDGKLLLSGGGQWDEAVHLWDAATGVCRLRLPGHDIVRSVAFSPDGKRIAGGFGLFSSKADKYVCVWETETGKELYRSGPAPALGPRLFARRADPSAQTAARPPCSGSRTNTTRRLEGERDSGGAAAFSPDGKVVATGSTVLKDPTNIRDAEYLISLWDAASGRLSAHAPRPREQPSGLHLSPRR